MSKLIAFWMFIFLGGMLFSGAANGGGGIVTTNLTSTVSENDMTINVVSTTNYLTADYIWIENEQIYYAGKTSTSFTGCIRGENGTAKATHTYIATKPLIVYNEAANIMNSSLNANITAIASNSGWFSIVTVPYAFFKGLPNLFNFTQAWFQGDMAIVAYFFLACAVGFVLSIALSMLWVAVGIVKLF